MTEHRLIAREEILVADEIRRRRELRRQGAELFFLQAVNFEITYHCGMSCSHCLQRNLRGLDIVELDTDTTVRAMRQIWFAALPLSGINLTGGEPLGPDSPVLELIAEASSLGLPVRLNTNSWWGDGEDLRIGHRVFSTPEVLVAHLREIGLSMLAFSYDDRMRENNRALKNLIGAMRACEQNRMPYHIIFTGFTAAEMESVLDLAPQEIPFPLDHAIPVMMEKVDLGGAAGSLSGQRRRTPTLVDTAMEGSRQAGRYFCGGKGYYRPSYLHIGPDGAIRTCLYAPGLENFGHLAREELLDAVNRFPADPVSHAFADDEFPRYEERLFKPYAHLYRSIVHPCAACAVLARVIEEEHRFTLTERHPPAARQLEKIHRRIAWEYNLDNAQHE